MCGEPDRAGVHRPEAHLGTCQEQQGGAEPQGLRRLPGVPKGGQGGPGGVLCGVLLPAQTPAGELSALAAESGAVLSALRAAGPAREPGGGGEVGSRCPGALCPATAAWRR